MKSGKGGNFERKISKALSLWWSRGKNDAVFWRTSQSGGRATERSKKGKKTKGQDADYCATDPIGQPLMDLCTIESKTGYGTASIMDLIDRLDVHNPPYGKFFEQCIQENKNSGRCFWMLISRRYNRSVMIYMPLRLYTLLIVHGAKLLRAKPSLSFQCTLKNGKKIKVYATTFKSFTRVKFLVRAFKRLNKSIEKADE